MAAWRASSLTRAMRKELVNDAPARSVRNMLCPLCKRRAGWQVAPVLSSRRVREYPEAMKQNVPAMPFVLASTWPRKQMHTFVASCILQS